MKIFLLFCELVIVALLVLFTLISFDGMRQSIAHAIVILPIWACICGLIGYAMLTLHRMVE